jgi:hypothetical protein
MSWELEATEDFTAWFTGLKAAERVAIATKIEVLQAVGPSLGRPDVDTVKGSKYTNMKELRIQYGGKPYRVFFAFDPRRTGILLVGGLKSGKGWYTTMISEADNIYGQYLKELKQEGLI